MTRRTWALFGGVSVLWGVPYLFGSWLATRAPVTVRTPVTRPAACAAD